LCQSWWRSFHSLAAPAVRRGIRITTAAAMKLSVRPVWSWNDMGDLN
jgi:hypothetical protein